MSFGLASASMHTLSRRASGFAFSGGVPIDFPSGLAGHSVTAM